MEHVRSALACTLAGLSARDPALVQLLRPLGPLDCLAPQPQTPATHLSSLTQVAAGPAPALAI